MKRQRSAIGLLMCSLSIILMVSLGGCDALGMDQSDWGSSPSAERSACGPCDGSGRCNSCNGTGRFLGFGDTSCNTCSGTGVCINCGGRGR
jgi:hypothetical protein